MTYHLLSVPKEFDTADERVSQPIMQALKNSGCKGTKLEIKEHGAVDDVYNVVDRDCTRTAAFVGG